MAVDPKNRFDTSSLTTSGTHPIKFAHLFSTDDKQLQDGVWARHHGDEEKNIPDERHQKVFSLGSTDSHGAENSLTPGHLVATMQLQDGSGELVLGTIRPLDGLGSGDNAGMFHKVATMNSRIRQNYKENKTAPNNCQQSKDQDTTLCTKTQETKPRAGSEGMVLAQHKGATQPIEDNYKDAENRFQETGDLGYPTSA